MTHLFMSVGWVLSDNESWIHAYFVRGIFRTASYIHIQYILNTYIIHIIYSHIQLSKVITMETKGKSNKVTSKYICKVRQKIWDATTKLVVTGNKHLLLQCSSAVHFLFWNIKISPLIKSRFGPSATKFRRRQNLNGSKQYMK